MDVPQQTICWLKMSEDRQQQTLSSTRRHSWCRWLSLPASFWWLVFCSLAPSKVQSFSTHTIHWRPVKVTLDNVSQSYPVSLWRKLTSSEPRREYALENISLTFESPCLHMLLGGSSAGKSTILRLIRGTESPVAGEVLVENLCGGLSCSRPVYLDSRPSYGLSESVGVIWKKHVTSTFEFGDLLMDEVGKILQIDPSSKIQDLSTSQVCVCKLGESCLQSMLSNAPGTSRQNDDEITVSAPILLLDEWLDYEASEVVQNIQSALQRLAAKGAVIIFITHKPQLFRLEEGTTHQVTLRRGKLVSSSKSAIPPQL